MPSLAEEVAERISRLRIPFNSAGVDPYGVSREHLQQAAVMLTRAYRSYFHVQCHGVENVPSEGRCMLVCNHSGGYALDASMLATACFLELSPPRLAHGMVDRFITQVPFLSEWASRLGQITGLPQHARRLLTDERLLMVFPEGVRGTAKLFRQRHSLLKFGTGFLRLAMETKTPIVPVAVLGGGEAVPTVMNLYKLGKLFGTPYIPITPYLMAFPLPVKIMIRFGPMLRFDANGEDSEASLFDKVESVRREIAQLIEEGRSSYKIL